MFAVIVAVLMIGVASPEKPALDKHQFHNPHLPPYVTWCYRFANIHETGADDKVSKKRWHLQLKMLVDCGNGWLALVRGLRGPEIFQRYWLDSHKKRLPPVLIYRNPPMLAG